MSEVMQIGGVDLRCLAQKVGTPFLIYDETKVEQKLQAFRHHFVHPEFETQVVYAGKAFLCGKIVRMVHEARLRARRCKRRRAGPLRFMPECRQSTS